MQQVNFLTSKRIRDEWFADEGHKVSQRYFWASQVLASANDRIQAMFQAYREQLTDDIWTGKGEAVWPIADDKDVDRLQWQQVIDSLRHEFEQILSRLEDLMERNDREQRDIAALLAQVSYNLVFYPTRERGERLVTDVNVGL